MDHQPTTINHQLPVYALDAAADAAQDLLRDGADRGRHLAHVDALVALLADDDDLVARLHLDAGDVDHHHVHGHGADDRRAAAANQHAAAAGEAQVDAISVPGGTTAIVVGRSAVNRAP